MEQKLEEIKKENNEEATEYFEFIKTSVKDGSYFKDALDWYFFRYVTPICDRTLLIFGAIIAAFVLFFLIQMVRSAFPLVEAVPIFIEAQDQTVSFPSLARLKPKKNENGYDPGVTTVDEAVAKYLISTYVKDREGYDFSSAEVEDVNRKFTRIRNASSSEEYRNFQLIMSKDNPNSPINQFGQSVVKTIEIKSVKFVKKEATDFASKAREFLSVKIPTEAEVRFVAITKTRNLEDGTSKEERENYASKIRFVFEGVGDAEKKSMLKFTINNYQLFKVK